jgi:hypothetical protein
LNTAGEYKTAINTIEKWEIDSKLKLHKKKRFHAEEMPRNTGTALERNGNQLFSVAIQ